MAWRRRARPLLGTLVEIGVRSSNPDGVIDAAFATIARMQACLSRFEPGSDISRFHALAVGSSLRVGRACAEVLHAAQALRDASDGLFDISTGSARYGWHCDGVQLVKLGAAVRLDLGGIAKGYAVDRAVEVLVERGCRGGWVNAGGDLRAFGEAALPLMLRAPDEGGVRLFGTLADGAFATSCLNRCFGVPIGKATAKRRDASHVSVASPQCIWADALTKVVAASGDASHPVLARYLAQAWLH